MCFILLWKSQARQSDLSVLLLPNQYDANPIHREITRNDGERWCARTSRVPPPLQKLLACARASSPRLDFFHGYRTPAFAASAPLQTGRTTFVKRKSTYWHVTPCNTRSNAMPSEPYKKAHGLTCAVCRIDPRLAQDVRVALRSASVQQAFFCLVRGSHG